MMNEFFFLLPHCCVNYRSVSESHREGFRMRANNFKIWRTGDKTEGFWAHYGMFERGGNRTSPHKVESYGIADDAINTVLSSSRNGKLTSLLEKNDFA